MFKGVDKDYHFEGIESVRMKGQWPALNDSGYSNELMISQYLADQLQLDIDSSNFNIFYPAGKRKTENAKTGDLRNLQNRH
jgi:lipoprotein-releasing system permease protein